MIGSFLNLFSKRLREKEGGEKGGKKGKKRRRLLHLPLILSSLDGAHAGAEAVVPAPGLLREGVAPARVRQHSRVTGDRRFFSVGHGVLVAKPRHFRRLSEVEHDRYQRHQARGKEKFRIVQK